MHERGPARRPADRDQIFEQHKQPSTRRTMEFSGDVAHRFVENAGSSARRRRKNEVGRGSGCPSNPPDRKQTGRKMEIKTRENFLSGRKIGPPLYIYGGCVKEGGTLPTKQRPVSRGIRRPPMKMRHVEPPRNFYTWRIRGHRTVQRGGSVGCAGVGPPRD